MSTNVSFGIGVELAVLTDMKVPGKKKSVTRVIVRMETVSTCVRFAISCISLVILSIRIAESCARSARIFVASIFLYWRMPCSYTSSVLINNLIWSAY